MNRLPLTPRQQEVYQFLISYIGKQQYPPSMREIAEAFSISVKAVHDHIRALERKGAIRYTPRRSRSIEIIGELTDEEESGGDVIQLPLLGHVAAGAPLFAEENFDGTFPISESLLPGSGEYFALKVEGDSMVDAGILDGDFAVIEKCESASNGTIVVARTNEGSVTLKRFFKESNRFRLQAENSSYLPIYTSSVQILGRLRMIFRTY